MQSRVNQTRSTVQAKERIAGMQLAERCEVIGGDFFKSVPGADAYIMSHIIHDWDEDRCLTILGNCHKANPEARVLIGKGGYRLARVVPTDSPVSVVEGVAD